MTYDRGRRRCSPARTWKNVDTKCLSLLHEISMYRQIIFTFSGIHVSGVSANDLVVDVPVQSFFSRAAAKRTRVS